MENKDAVNRSTYDGIRRIESIKATLVGEVIKLANGDHYIVRTRDGVIKFVEVSFKGATLVEFLADPIESTPEKAE